MLDVRVLRPAKFALQVRDARVPAFQAPGRRACLLIHPCGADSSKSIPWSVVTGLMEACAHTIPILFACALAPSHTTSFFIPPVESIQKQFGLDPNQKLGSNSIDARDNSRRETSIS